MYTTYLKESIEIPYIPAKIVTAEPQLGVHIDGNYVCCGNWLGHEFAMVGDSYELIFHWVIYGMKSFVFKTHHSLNSTLLDFLECCRAIRRYDGKADLIQLANFEYDVFLRECDQGYVVDKIEPQDQSYFCNVKAFYDEASVFADLTKQAKNSNLIPHPQNRIALEFEHGTGKEIYYTDYLPMERLLDETFQYSMCTDTYSFGVVVGVVSRSGMKTADENHFYLTLLSKKNVYPIRIKINDFLFSLLARMGVLRKGEGCSDIDLDTLYKVEFDIVFRFIGSKYKFLNLTLKSKNEEEYWNHLIQLADVERESYEQ